ncbi:MAG: hypothetical protein ACLFRY_12085 [Spirochaetia bacterium]
MRNPLFPVNYLDRQIRKDNSNHLRKTVQFSRDVDSRMERMAVYQRASIICLNTQRSCSGSCTLITNL